MKAKFHEKTINALKLDIKNKEAELKTQTDILMLFIKDKASSSDTENQITKRNLLFIDISNLEMQIKNIQRGKKQYGEPIEERCIRNWE